MIQHTIKESKIFDAKQRYLGCALQRNYQCRATKSDFTNSTLNSTKFVSHIQSRIEEKGTLYGHFQLGTFVAGQALTTANALRRTLLGEIPAFIITSIQIEGGETISLKIDDIFNEKPLIGINSTELIQQNQEDFSGKRSKRSRKQKNDSNFLGSEKDSQNLSSFSEEAFGEVIHEFSSLPGIQENVLNILLNLKQMVIASQTENFFSYSTKKLFASLNIRGPKIIRAKDIQFPTELTAVDPSHYIATLSANGELKMKMTIQCVDPLNQQDNLNVKNTQQIKLDTQPKPIKQVNFGIFELPSQPGKEYISLEIWTDGSLTPKQALGFSLEKLTRIFYDFTTLHQNVTNSFL